MLANVSNDWKKILEPGLSDVVSQITEETSPPINQWFEFARLTPMDEIKIILLGQDPYPKDAHGLSFSCKTRIPGSLKNVFKCLLKSNIFDELPQTGDLSGWAKQGVLLLNTALSTSKGKIGSHLPIWQKYTLNLLKNISSLYKKEDKQLIFFLWGNKSKAYKKHLSSYHVYLESVHPSPMAQTRLSMENKFIYCGHFSCANFLLSLDYFKIDWKKGLFKKPKRSRLKKAGLSTNLVFTDGSCHPNNKSKYSRGGYAGIFISGPLMGHEFLGRLCTKNNNASNIRAEGKAIIEAIRRIKMQSEPYEIITDCEFWVNMLYDYMPKWSRAKFTKQKNSDLTHEIYQLWKSTPNVSISHMYGHGKSGWGNYPKGTREYKFYKSNEKVDKMCKEARNFNHYNIMWR